MTAIGIDLGTSNCCMAYVKDDKPIIIPNQSGDYIIPSYICFKNNEILFGKTAIQRMVNFEENTIYDVKRFIGRNFDDPFVQKFIDKWKFKLVNYRGKINVAVKIKDEEKMYSPEMLSGLLLKHLKKQAEIHIGEPVTKAVITVPTYFNDAQRQATIDAGKIGGFQEVKLLNEPTAAAIIYSIENNADIEKTILVFDFGGGTFDVSIVKFKNRDIKVIAIDGDVELGGNDITQILFEVYGKKLKEEFGFDVNKKKMHHTRFKAMCEEAKKTLFTSVEANLQLYEIIPDEDVEIVISRDEFNRMSSAIFNRTIEIIDRCLKKINMDVNKIDEFVVVGGSSRIKKNIEMLELFFKRPLRHTISADQAVALGAAVAASKLSENFIYKDVQFTDICPYSLGVETAGKHMSVIIPKYSTLPAKATKIYCNTKDNQTVIKVKIFAGEDESTENNTFISDLAISGFRPGPAKSIKLYETFIYDENGILSVDVEGPSTEKKNLIINLDKGRLSEEDLQEQAEVIDAQYKEVEEFQSFKEMREEVMELCTMDLMRKEVPSQCNDLLKFVNTLNYSSKNFETLKEQYELFLKYYEMITN